MVGAQFQDAFSFNPISTVFAEVLKAFELRGSVTEDVVYAIKEEPVVQSHAVVDEERHNDPDNDFSIKEDHPGFFKEESFDKEETPANAFVATSYEALQTPADVRERAECKICHAMVVAQDMQKHRRDVHNKPYYKNVECEVCYKQVLATNIKVGNGVILSQCISKIVLPFPCP